MSRTRRWILAGQPHHVRARGNNRQDLFLDEEDLERFSGILIKILREEDVRAHHYCLMSNHVHFVLVPGSAKAMSRFMQRVLLTYYHLLHKKYDYVGHVTQGRYFSTIIDTELYFLSCGKYIELNPVRARIVARPRDYRFSSYSFYAEGEPDPLVTASPTYVALAGTDRRRRELYRDLVVDPALIDSEKLRKERCLGSEAFKSRIMRAFGGFPRRPGRHRKHE